MHNGRHHHHDDTTVIIHDDDHFHNIEHREYQFDATPCVDNLDDCPYRQHDDHQPVHVDLDTRKYINDNPQWVDHLAGWEHIDDDSEFNHFDVPG
jgi:hypothetical protein